jgi:hypothetical protein
MPGDGDDDRAIYSIWSPFEPLWATKQQRVNLLQEAGGGHEVPILGIHGGQRLILATPKSK